MKRLFVLLAAALLLTGCRTAPQKKDDRKPVEIDRAADPVLNAADGAVLLDEQTADAVGFQMLVPAALQWYADEDGTVRYSDRSGHNLMTFAVRPGDDTERCYRSYLHDIGCALPANRIKTYDPQEIGAGGYTAYRIDAREAEADSPERLMTYWFIDRPRQAGKRKACYIVSIETESQNLDVMMKCIGSFALPGDFTEPEQEVQHEA